jgi:Calcium-dependent channel, 7TM region, putative phosphate
LFSFVPSVVLLVITSAIPNIFAVVQPAERLVLRSEEEDRVFHKSFWFLLFYILILPSVLLTTTDSLVRDLAEKDGLRVAFMPNSGAFFVNYLVTLAFLSNVIELLRPVDLFASIRGRSRAFRPMKFHYGTQYAWVTAVFCAALFFTCTVPLAVPVGALYFAFKYYVDKFNLCFACSLPEWAIQQRRRRDGSMTMHGHVKGLVHARETDTAFSALRYLLLSVLIFAVGMVYYYFMREAEIPALVVAVLVCVFLLAFAWRHWRRQRFWAGARKRRLSQLHAQRRGGGPQPLDDDAIMHHPRRESASARESRGSQNEELDRYLRHVAESAYTSPDTPRTRPELDASLV